ncbi:MAG: MBL fold metallo-hydrolase [Planctomycetota bacterium]
MTWLLIAFSMWLAQPTDDDDDVLFDITEIARGVHAVMREQIGANGAIVITDRDVIVVDSQSSPAAARALLPRIRKLTDLPIRLVVNTHWHTDHVLGNRAYLESLPQPFDIVAHAATRRDISRLGPGLLPATVRFGRQALERGRNRLKSEAFSEVQRSDLTAFLDDYELCLDQLSAADLAVPTMTFEGELTLHRGGQEIRLVHLGPAHTAGDVVVVLPEERVAMAGDLLTAPRLYADPGADLNRWLEALRFLDDKDLAVIVPGHGPLLRGEEHLHRMIAVLELVLESSDEASLLERGADLRPQETDAAAWSAFLRETLAVKDSR